jgi:hypothetical protein
MKKIIVLVFLIFLSYFQSYAMGFYNYSYSLEYGEDNYVNHSLGYEWLIPSMGGSFHSDFGINFKYGDYEGWNIYYNILFNRLFDYDLGFLYYGLGANVSFNTSQSYTGIGPQINLKFEVGFNLNVIYRYNFYSKNVNNSHEVEFTIGIWDLLPALINYSPPH